MPDLLDGSVSGDLSFGVFGDSFWGKRGDYTTDVALKLILPLFSDRVNVSFWMPYIEFYTNTEENIRACRIENVTDKRLYKGHFNGDVYFSCDVQVVREKKFVPGVTARAILKTASSDGYYLARFYDSPGYVFDASIGKGITFSNSGIFTKFRISGSLGFLCWQTDNGRQNDALLYGIQLKLIGSKFDIGYTLSGYSGWESSLSNNLGAHDRLMSLKINATYHLGKFDIITGCQQGIRDYPYFQLRLGTAFHWDILGRKRIIKNHDQIK